MNTHQYRSDRTWLEPVESTSEKHRGWANSCFLVCSEIWFFAKAIIQHDLLISPLRKCNALRSHSYLGLCTSIPEIKHAGSKRELTCTFLVPTPYLHFGVGKWSNPNWKNIRISTDLCNGLRRHSFTRETSSGMQLQDLMNFIDFTCTVLVSSRNSNIFDVKSSIVFVRIFIIPSRSGFLIVLTTKIAFVSPLYLQADFASMKCSRHIFYFHTW